MPETQITSLNRANPSTLSDHFRKVRVGDLIAGHLPQQLRKKDPAAQLNELATVEGLGLPYYARAASILRATVRAGGVTGELTPQVYGTTPATTQIAVSPSGDIVVLAADAITDLDVSYVPEDGEVFVSATLPAPAGVLTIPTQLTARGVVLLLEAEAITATITGRKIVLVPGAAPATLQARLNVAKTQVLFNFATDVVTAARVTLLVARPAAQQLDAVLASAPTTV